MSEVLISEGAEVTLHFALLLDDGAVVDSNFDSAPATFTVGDGNLLPGFERALFGLSAGTKESFDIEPEAGFGQPNPNNVQRFKRSEFDSEIELQPGLMLSFADASNSELPGVVAEFDDEFVTIDFNHPLAGKTIRFDVEIVSVREAQ